MNDSGCHQGEDVGAEPILSPIIWSSEQFGFGKPAPIVFRLVIDQHPRSALNTAHENDGYCGSIVVIAGHPGTKSGPATKPQAARPIPVKCS